ncbi:hypothetical protein LUZ60_006446 [Juncus effusus]|nr:hypothetical protein LUZ60_006446 [Juncus effusus]
MVMKLYAFQPRPSPNFNHTKTSYRIQSLLTRPKSLFQSTPKLSYKTSALKPTKSTPKTINTLTKSKTLETLSDAIPRWFLIGGASLAITFLLLDQKEAMALGPEGPLLEEFWDNMRRYALYALTVSTGVIYAVVEPILELLKNPITAILIVVVIAGIGFILSQVVNAMVGNSDFAYTYGY